MQLDAGEIRFLTKVAEKSPRGLRLLLFKQKSSGLEKLVFIVKTASQDIDKLALSKMTWQVEQSKAAARVVVVRMIILPEGSNEFFQSETGLLMNDDKDRKSLQALVNQKSIEIYFFNYENEFHSRIELMTTYNMHKAAEERLNANPVIDEGKMIVKSENLSEKDVKDAIKGKVKETSINDKELMDSIQKKMPTMSNVSPKTKTEEHTKTSIKSNDIASTGNYGNTVSAKPESKKDGINLEDIKKAASVPPGKITPEELLKSLPPNKFTAQEIMNSAPVPDLNNLKAEDLLKVVDSIPPGKITPEELLKSIPPNKIFSSDINNSISPDLNAIKAEDLLKVVDSIPPGKITTDELLKSLPPNQLNSKDVIENNSSAFLTPEELLNSLKSMPAESGIKVENIINKTSDSPKPTGNDSLNKNNLSDIIKNDDPFGFFDSVPTKEVDNQTREMKKDDLLSALMSEESPLKLSQEEEKSLLTDLMSEASPLKSSDGESELAKNLEENIKSIKPVSGNNIQTNTTNIKKEELSSWNPSISADDLLKALNGEG